MQVVVGGMQRQRADSPEAGLRLLGPREGLLETQRCWCGLQEATVMWRWRWFWWGSGVGAAVAQSPQRDASTFRVAAGVEWGAMERARAQWRGHLGTLKPL